MVTTQNLEAYYQEVKRGLGGSPSYKQRILENLKNDAEAFLGDHPEATEQDIRQYFGKPEDFIREYEATMTQHERMKRGKLRRSILKSVIAVLLAGLLVWTCGVISATVEANRHSSGSYFTDIIIE